MLEIETFWHLNCVLMLLNWIVWNRTVLTFKLRTYAELFEIELYMHKNVFGCWGVSPTDGLALRWDIPDKLSSVLSRRAVTMNGCNVHDCVNLRRGFSQLSFMYVLFSFSISFITHFRVVLSFQPPLEHNIGLKFPTMVDMP